MRTGAMGRAAALAGILLLTGAARAAVVGPAEAAAARMEAVPAAGRLAAYFASSDLGLSSVLGTVSALRAVDLSAPGARAAMAPVSAAVAAARLAPAPGPAPAYAAVERLGVVAHLSSYLDDPRERALALEDYAAARSRLAAPDRERLGAMMGRMAAALGVTAEDGDAPREQAPRPRAALLRPFSRARPEARRLALRRLLREGATALAVGFTFLAACLSLNHVVAVSSLPLGDVLKEGLNIAGWVGMWRPMNIFLYEWWPIFSRGRVYDKLSVMDVEVVVRPRDGHAGPQ